MSAAFPAALEDLADGFGEWFGALLETEGVSPYEVVKAMNPDAPTHGNPAAYQWLHGRAVPSLRNLARLMRVFDEGGAYVVPASMLRTLAEGAAWARRNGWKG